MFLKRKKKNTKPSTSKKQSSPKQPVKTEKGTMKGIF